MQSWKETLESILFDPTVGKIVLTIIGLGLIYTFTKIAKKNLGRIVTESSNRYYIKKVISFVSFFVAIMFLGTIFSDKLGSLSVALGVAGAGIAFALQEIIVSVAGWLAIVFGGFYSTGDRVQLGGVKGDVIDIGVLRSTLMELGQWVGGDLYTGRIVKVANSAVFKDPVFNYSSDFPFLWDEFVLPIKWGSDIKKAQVLLLKVTEELVGSFADQSSKAWSRVVDKYRIEDAKLRPMVTYSLNSSQIDFTIRYIVDFKKRRTTKHSLSQAIIEALQTETSVKIASSSEIQITEIAAINTNVSDAKVDT